MIILEQVDDLNTSENNINFQKCISHKDSGKHLFLFMYMNGCGPRKDAKESWAKIKEHLEPEYLENKDIMLSQINHTLYDKKYKFGDEPMGFPTLRYIHNNNIEEYNEDREPEDFANWIKSKVKLRPNHKETHADIRHHTNKTHNSHSMKGGKRRRRKIRRTRKTRNTRKTRRTRKIRK